MRIQVKQDWKNITRPNDIAGIIQSILSGESTIDQDKEHFWVIGLNNNNLIKYIDLVSLGILDYCIVHPREIFRLAIMKSIKSIILAHNHPSGNITPSSEDLELTNRLVKAGEILCIKVLDHIIVSKEGFLSLSDQGVI